MVSRGRLADCDLQVVSLGSFLLWTPSLPKQDRPLKHVMKVGGYRESLEFGVREGRGCDSKSVCGCEGWDEVKNLERVFQIRGQASGIPCFYVLGRKDHIYVPCVSSALIIPAEGEAGAWRVPSLGNAILRRPGEEVV